MIITRKWLNNYIDLIGITNDDIIIAFNSLGFEVFRTIDYNKNSNLCVGRILSVNKILNSNLNFCLVVDMNDSLAYPIICEANNLREEMYVIVAKSRS